MSELDKLIEAVEAGVLTEDQALGNGGCLPMCHSTWLAFSGSLDAALALHEALLPNRYWNLQEWDGAWTAQIPVSSYKRHEATDEASPARAWLLAVLRAYRSMQE